MTTLEASLKLRDQFTTVLKTIDSSLSQTAQTMSSFKQKATGPAQALNQMASLASSAVGKLNSTMRNGLSGVWNVVQSTTERILSLFGNFGNRISSVLNLDGVSSKISSTFSGIGKAFNDFTGRTKKLEAIDNINRQLDQLSNKEAKININIDKAAGVQNDIEQIDVRLQRLASTKADIQANVSNVDVAAKRIDLLDQHMQRLSNRKAVLEVEAGKIDKAKSHLADVQNEIDKLNNQKVSLNTSAFSSVLSKLTSGFSSLISASASAAQKIGSNFTNAFNGAKNSFKQFGNDLKSGFSGIKESTGQATTGVKGFVTALGLMKVAGAAIGVVKGSIDGAIDRFDTLNQFPKMMQAVGFSMEEVDDSRQRLVDGIDGLPTALNEIVPTTQRIATMTGDLDNATKTTISLNNAFLASGADSARAAQGLEQYVQMLGRGEVNLTSWRSLMDTMPVALNDVAKAFGYTGESAQYDLYDALDKGHVTFDQFNAKLIELFDTGTEGAKRALIGSEGIKTSFKNIRTAVTNGVEGSIRKLDEMSEAFSGKTIAQHLDSGKDLVRGFFKSINGYTDESGEYIAGFMDKIPGMIEKVRPYLNVLKDAFEDIKEPIVNAVSAVKDSLADLTGSFGSEASVNGFKGFVDSITSGISKLAGFIEKHSDTIAKFIAFLPKLAAAIIGFKIGKGILTPLFTFGKAATTVVGATAKLAKGLGGSFLNLFGFGKKAAGGAGGASDMGAQALTKPLDTFLNTMNGFAKGVTNLALIFGVILLIKQAAQALKDVSEKIPDDLGSLAAKLGMMAVALVGMGALVAVAGKLADKNLDQAIAGLAIVAGLSLNLMLAAESMKQIDEKVPNDFGNFAAKLGHMTVALLGMGAIVAVAGVLASLNPAAAILGLIAVAAISLELMLAAEAMKQVDEKVPDDIGSFAAKVANMAIAIGAFAGLAGVIGVVMATGIGGAAILLGLAAIALVALELMLVAEAIQQVDQKVPDNFDSVKTKITTLIDVIQFFASANLGTIGDVFSNLVGLINAAVVSQVIDQLISVAEKLNELAGIDIASGIEEKIRNLLAVVDVIGGEGGFWKAVQKSFKSGFDASMLGNVSESVAAMVQIANDLSALQLVPLTASAVKVKVTDIIDICDLIAGDSGFWSSLKDKFSSGFDTTTFSNASKSLDHIIQIASDLSALSTIPFSKEPIQKRLTDVLEIIDLIGDGKKGFWGKLTDSFGAGFDASALKNVSKSVDHLIQIASDLAMLTNVPLKADLASKKIEEIGNVIEQLNEFPELVGLDGIESMVNTFNQLAEELQSFISMAEVSISGLEGVSSSFETNMSTMQTSTESTMQAIQDAAQSGMNGFNTAIDSGMSTAAATAERGKGQIVRAFSGLRGELQAAGHHAMSGLTAGIQAGAGSAIAAAQSVASRVASTVRKALDIHSPSRVMMAIGGFVSEGLAKGILAAQNLVQDASAALAMATIPDQLATVSASGIVTSSVHVDDDDIARLKTSASQTVIVQHKQVVPHVTVNVENNGGEPIDVDEIVERVEEVILDAIDSDLS